MEAGEAERLHDFIERAPFRRRLAERRKPAPALAMPRLSLPAGETMSTQEGFGRLMLDLAKAGGKLAERVVTTSPDVTVSTNLGGWVNQVGLFAHTPHSDVFRDRKLLSAQKWVRGLEGRHIELG
ncbi:MAG TPA: transketolase, partial [Dongiaceae bacterium]